MGTDCALLIKVKGEEKKYYKRTLDRLYCFEHLSIGPEFEIEHDGLKDNNGLIDGRRSVRTSDEIKWDHAIQWARDRIAFLTANKDALEKDNTDVQYHLWWVTDLFKALWSISGWDPPSRSQTLESNIETLWLAADNGETYDDIVFDDGNEVIDLKYPEKTNGMVS